MHGWHGTVSGLWVHGKVTFTAEPAPAHCCGKYRCWQWLIGITTETRRQRLSYKVRMVCHGVNCPITKHLETGRGFPCRHRHVQTRPSGRYGQNKLSETSRRPLGNLSETSARCCKCCSWCWSKTLDCHCSRWGCIWLVGCSRPCAWTREQSARCWTMLDPPAR